MIISKENIIFSLLYLGYEKIDTLLVDSVIEILKNYNYKIEKTKPSYMYFQNIEYTEEEYRLKESRELASNISKTDKYYPLGGKIYKENQLLIRIIAKHMIEIDKIYEQKSKLTKKKTGQLIVMEGSCDGIGKSTQFKLLGERLTKEGVELCTHHFPSYNTPQGSPVEMYLKGTLGHPQELSAYFINSLYAIDREITWLTKLKEEYEKGKTILLDRYTTSSIIYQSALIEDIEKKKDFINYICDFEYQKLGLQQPNKVIFLEAPFELVQELRRKRKSNEGIINDIHESDLEFMRKVYDSAIFLADYLGWEKVQCNQGNKMKSIKSIHKKVYKLTKTNN